MIRHWGTGKTCHAEVASVRPPARFERITQRERHLRTLTDPTARVRES